MRRLGKNSMVEYLLNSLKDSGSIPNTKLGLGNHKKESERVGVQLSYQPDWESLMVSLRR